MPILAARMRAKEKDMFLMPNPPIFFRNRINKIINEVMPEMDVAKARPLILSGNISMEFKIIFVTKAMKAIFAGVIVSLRLKKQDWTIFVPPYANKPIL
jgi:hypothetical protein